MCDLIGQSRRPDSLACPASRVPDGGQRGEPIDSWASSGPGRGVRPRRDSLSGARPLSEPGYLAQAEGVRIRDHRGMSSRGFPSPANSAATPLRVGLPRALAFQRNRRGRGRPLLRLRQDTFRGRRLHPPEGAHPRRLRRASPARAALLLGMPGQGRLDRRETVGGHAERGLQPDVLRHRIGERAGLRLMNKRITTTRAREALEAARAAGIATGAFFILFYPGDTTTRCSRPSASPLPAPRLSSLLAALSHTRDGPPRAGRGSLGPRVAAAPRPGLRPLPHFRRGLLRGEDEVRPRQGQDRIRAPEARAAAGSPALRLFRGPTDLVLRLLK